MRRCIAILSFITLWTLCPVAVANAQLTSNPQFFAVSPKASIYRASGNDSPASPTLISLSGLGGGTIINLTPSGGFQAAGGPVSPPLFSALFSSSNVLSPDITLLNRVPGAIDAGASYYQNLIIMGPTYYGGQPTDIPEDFTIPNGGFGNGLSIAIPTGANWLFVQMMDDYYADNATPDPSTFGVVAYIESAPVTATPEPSTIFLTATGLIALAAWRRRVVAS